MDAAAAELGGIDPYKVLRLDAGASKEAIGKAARKLGLKYHPDKNTTDPEAPALFLQVQKAKEFLLDDVKRKAYDEARAATAKRKQYDEDRNSTMDDKRKRFRDDLEDKVRQAAAASSSSAGAPAAATQAAASSSKAPSKKAAHDLKEVNRLRQENLARMDDTAREREQQRKKEPPRQSAPDHAAPSLEPPALAVAPISAAALQAKETDVLQRMLEAARKKKAAVAAAAAAAAAGQPADAS